MTSSDFLLALKSAAHGIWKLVKFILIILATILLITVPLGFLQMAMQYHWALGFPFIVWFVFMVSLSIRDFQSGKISTRQGIMALVGIMLLTISIFAFLSFVLYKFGVAHYQGFTSQALDKYIMGSLVDFYAWQLFQILPALSVNEALGWSVPLVKSGFVAGVLLLAFRVVIIFVVLDVFRKWWATHSSIENNKTLIKRWFEEVWSKGRAEAIDEMFAAHGIAHGLSDEPGKTMRGPADFKPFHSVFRGAFPNIEVSIEDAIAEGDMIAVRCSVRGKHTGDHLGIAASDSPVEFTGMVMARIKDGMFVEVWNNFDFLQMNKQIGVI